MLDSNLSLFWEAISLLLFFVCLVWGFFTFNARIKGLVVCCIWSGALLRLFSFHPSFSISVGQFSLIWVFNIEISHRCYCFCWFVLLGCFPHYVHIYSFNVNVLIFCFMILELYFSLFCYSDTACKFKFLSTLGFLSLSSCRYVVWCGNFLELNTCFYHWLQDPSEGIFDWVWYLRFWFSSEKEKKRSKWNAI